MKTNKAHMLDITYGTNNELGFDYLRDNMAFKTEHRVQRELNFAIVDEVDSILIDEARTPLIISGPSDDYSNAYRAINQMIPHFTEQKESGEEKTWLLKFLVISLLTRNINKFF